MKILLLNPPYVPEFMRSARWAAVSISGSNWYPIYLAYCTGLLEKYGHKTKLVDGPVDKLSHEDVLKMAKNFSADISVLYISDKSLENDIAIGEKIKELTGSYIAMVGPWCSCVNPDELLKNSKIDAFAIGEFDYTILEFAEGKSENTIDGLVWKNNGKVIRNPPRKPLTSEQINEFPFVTDVYRRHLNIRNYFQAPHLHPFVDLFTGRGCSWGKCTFCLWPHTINKDAPYRVGDINRTIEELEFIKEELPFVKEVFIQDDTLPAWRAGVLSTAIIAANLDITWSCYARPDATYDLETLKLMKKSGCRCLHVGYESSNPQILKNIKKGTTSEIMVKFTEMTHKVGLSNHADFIIGLPGETVETIIATVKWARKLKVNSYQFTRPYPYPRTPFYAWLEKNAFLNNGKVNCPHLSTKEIDKWVRWALRKTNLNPRYLLRMIKRPKEWKRLIRSARYVLPNVVGK
jgi:radical SAM superfamily enzyme YgiQ (UPF0313 family)